MIITAWEEQLYLTDGPEREGDRVEVRIDVDAFWREDGDPVADALASLDFGEADSSLPEW